MHCRLVPTEPHRKADRRLRAVKHVLARPRPTTGCAGLRRHDHLRRLLGCIPGDLNALPFDVVIGDVAGIELLDVAAREVSRIESVDSHTGLHHRQHGDHRAEHDCHSQQRQAKRGEAAEDGA